MPLEDEGVPLTFLIYFTLTWTAMLISAGAGENCFSYRTHPSTTTTNLRKIESVFVFCFSVKMAGLVKDFYLIIEQWIKEAAHKINSFFLKKLCLLCVLFYLEYLTHFP